MNAVAEFANSLSLRCSFAGPAMLYLTGKEIAWIFVALILIVAVAYVVGVLAAIRSRSLASPDAARREEQRLNDGWRIAFIQPGSRPTAGRIVITLMIGPTILLFLVGFLLLVLDGGNSYLPGILIVGSVVLGGSLFLVGGLVIRHQRARWTVLAARCTDREIRKRISGDENTANRGGWLCRVVCEFDHDGRSYRTTPIVHRKFARVAECDFPSQEEAERFLHDRISPVGLCRLRVNPGNPLEGELC